MGRSQAAAVRASAAALLEPGRGCLLSRAAATASESPGSSNAVRRGGLGRTRCPPPSPAREAWSTGAEVAGKRRGRRAVRPRAADAPQRLPRPPATVGPAEGAPRSRGAPSRDAHRGRPVDVRGRGPGRRPRRDGATPASRSRTTSPPSDTKAVDERALADDAGPSVWRLGASSALGEAGPSN